ncbi:endonuclease/exonuclease/phosphatase family protein [Streptomyces sp. NPDC127103]|uniref:endonuclease/exonuclease/phosphatase family protein n=1 Tax=Streptomyces sp. NPDC127103 TaxID=3347139 RepID=UPI0036624177
MRRFGPLRALLTSLAFLCAAMTVTAPQARADVVTPSTAPPLRTVTYNICGSGGTAGCDVTASGNTKRYDAIVNETSATGWNADQIFLVEICKYQFDDLDQRLPASYVGHYASTLKPTAAGLCVNPANPSDTDNRDYGMALFVRGTKVDDATLTLHRPGDLPPVSPGVPQTEAIKAPCLKTYVQNRLNWACAVHLFWGTPGAGPMEEEARRLTDQTRQWESEGIPVVLGGDFNANPLTAPLSYFYDTSINNNATGTFVEADETDRDHFAGNPTVDCGLRDRCRTGESTFVSDKGDRKKLDFLFFSSRFFSGAVGDAFTEVRSISDHGRYRGAAYWADCLHPYTAAPGSVFRRDATGSVYRYDGRPSGDTAALEKPCKVGYGWQGMTHVARQGTTVAAVDPAGTLWHYPAAAADGSYSGSTRKQAGTGFQDDDALLTPGDFDGDGTDDLITRESTTGAFWLHRGTGAHSYAPRARIVEPGAEWRIYPYLVATDFARGTGTAQGTADIVAIDELGYLWLQEGNGDGTLAERRRIGNGWQVYDALAAPGDLNGDGNADLIGREDGGDLYYYKGDGAGGYAPRVKVGSNFPAGELLF